MTKYYFSKDKYIEEARSRGKTNDEIQTNLDWANECDGKEYDPKADLVIGTSYCSSKDWCIAKEVKE
jgi:hypothetical protein